MKIVSHHFSFHLRPHIQTTYLHSGISGIIISIYGYYSKQKKKKNEISSSSNTVFHTYIYTKSFHHSFTATSSQTPTTKYLCILYKMARYFSAAAVLNYLTFYAMQFDGWSLTRARIKTNSYEFVL